MQLYKTRKGNIVFNDNKAYVIDQEWDSLTNQKDLHAHLLSSIKNARAITDNEFKEITANDLLAPIGTQELWAAGVTYMRSRDARMEESQDKGSADCYQRVYDAERPELFFKSLPHRVSGHDGEVYIRKDSTWNVPEPELTLFINSNGVIQGYTIGNDMSSRSIEGENPLYLPQAKMYERSAALGPCLYVPSTPIDPDTSITLTIKRNKADAFNGSVELNRMKRKLPELAEWLFREMRFDNGCYLMTGTGLVPGDDFTLLPGDEVEISISNIGTLRNKVALQ